MAENKMAQVAELFGMKLGEEFKVKFTSFFWEELHTVTVRFTRDGLEYLTKYNAWEQINCFIPSLLTGRTVVVND